MTRLSILCGLCRSVASNQARVWKTDEAGSLARTLSHSVLGTGLTTDQPVAFEGEDHLVN